MHIQAIKLGIRGLCIKCIHIKYHGSELCLSVVADFKASKKATAPPGATRTPMLVDDVESKPKRMYIYYNMYKLT